MNTKKADFLCFFGKIIGENVFKVFKIVYLMDSELELTLQERIIEYEKRNNRHHSSVCVLNDQEYDEIPGFRLASILVEFF